MSGNVAPKISTNGLILYLDAGNTKSYPGTGTTWVDISQSGNNGTLINSPTFNSSNGGGIVFDGVDDYVTQSNITSNSLTFDFWFRVTDKTSGYHYVMSYGNNVAGQMVSISIANTAVGTYGISVREIYCFLGGSDPSLRGTDFIINFNNKMSAEIIFIENEENDNKDDNKISNIKTHFAENSLHSELPSVVLKITKPFLKWVGGKRQIMPSIVELLPKNISIVL